FGKPGRRGNANFMLGSSFRIESGLQTGLRPGDGRTMVVALFAAARLRRHCTSLPLVDTPRGSGTSSLHGWAISRWTQRNGRKPSQSNSGGRTL
ncbi:Os04g0453500, partial [Oryza sativa Japonica Group]